MFLLPYNITSNFVKLKLCEFICFIRSILFLTMNFVGINGVGTAAQKSLKVSDSVDVFIQDVLKSGEKN